MLAVLVLALGVAAAPANAAVPRCNGQRGEIVGSRKGETIRGTRGPDVIVGGGGGDTIFGGGGADLICGGKGADEIFGQRGLDGALGGRGNDVVNGGKGEFDFLSGDGGDDAIVGGSGSLDQAGYLSAAGPLVATLVADPLTGLGSATGQGNDTLSGVEGLVGSPQNDSLTGDAAANILEGSGGDDLLDGGDGFDIATWFFAPEADDGTGVTVDLAAGTASGTEGNDTVAGIERVEASEFDDTLRGSERDEELLGFGGRDSISSSGGVDLVVGHEGDDVLDAGDGDDFVFTDSLFTATPGNDLAVGGAGVDTVFFSESQSGVTVSLLAGTASGEGSDSLSGFESVVGSPRVDLITGDDGPNTLFGLARDDTLDGGAGTDALDGGNGTDSCINGETVTNCEAPSPARPTQTLLRRPLDTAATAFART